MEKINCKEGFISINNFGNIKLYQLNGIGEIVDNLMMSSMFQLLIEKSENYTAQEIWDEAYINTIRKQTGLNKSVATQSYNTTQNMQEAINLAKSKSPKF